MTHLPPAVRSLFKPPFVAFGIEGRAIFIYDDNTNMVASLSGTDRPLPRGHGRCCYLPDGIERHNAWCAWFESNVPARATLEEVADLLNQAWAVPA